MGRLFAFYLVLVVSKVICNREYTEIAMINMILMHLELSRRGQREVQLLQVAYCLFRPFSLGVTRTSKTRGERELSRFFLASSILLCSL